MLFGKLIASLFAGYCFGLRFGWKPLYCIMYWCPRSLNPNIKELPYIPSNYGENKLEESYEQHNKEYYANLLEKIYE